MIPASGKAINSLFFSSPVRSEPAVKRTAVSSIGVCVCHWYKFGVNLASDLFAEWRIKLNPEKNSHNILQVPNNNKGRTCFVFIR